MEQAFHFVDGLSNDEKAKKLMRRHVMKGKNAGKKVHRRSRLDLQLTRSRPNVKLNPSQIPSNLRQNYSHADWRCESPGGLSIEFRNLFLAFSIPMRVTPYSLEVINECKRLFHRSTEPLLTLQVFIYTSDRIYLVKLGVSIHHAKLRWMQVLFENEASKYINSLQSFLELTNLIAFQCSLALMQASNEIFHCDGGSSPKALYHLLQTFALVKKRLEGDDALSDSTIAIVMSLINQEQIRQQYSAAAVHVKGLEKMIELRGGLSQLEGNTALVLKICK
jgi:hypothetical protein